MEKRPSGLKFEPKHPKDFSHEKVFGSPFAEEIKPLGRLEKIRSLNLPVVFQGNQNTCVDCAVTYVKQYMEATGVKLSWEFLAQESFTGQDGATVNQVLEPSKKIGICTEDAWKNLKQEVEQKLDALNHRIGNYFFVKETYENVYHALKTSPVVIGVLNWNLVDGGHALVAVDVNENGNFVCANWWKENEQDYVVVDKSFPIEVAVSFGDLPNGVEPKDARMGLWLSIISFFRHFGKSKSPEAKTKRNGFLLSLALFLVLFGIIKTIPNIDQNRVKNASGAILGASGVLSAYRDTIASPGIANTDATIPISSGKLFTGETFASTDLIFPTYLVINPGGATQEIVECHGFSTSPLQWTGCNRGLSAKGSNTTSTVSAQNFAHSAGESIIMSNPAYYYSAHFMDLQTAQTVTGTKTFAADQVLIGSGSSSTNKYIFFPNNQTNSPYFKIVSPSAGNTTSTFFFSVDGSSDLQLNASGTTFGASSTRAMGIANGLVQLNASTTQGLTFDSSGSLAIVASSTASANGGFIKFATSTLGNPGGIYFDALNFLAGGLNAIWTWTAANIFNASTTFIGTSTFAGNATATGNFQVTQTPNSANDAVNKSYVDSLSTSATGTASMLIAAGQAIAVNTTGTLILASSANTSTGYAFVGIATVGASQNGTVTYVKPGGFLVKSNQSAGSYIYLNDTAGSFSGNKGATLSVRIGIAVEQNKILIMTPRFNQIKSGSSTIIITPGTVTTVTTNFSPNKITIYAGGAENYAVCQGTYTSSTDGTSAQFSIGTKNFGIGSNALKFDQNAVCDMERNSDGTVVQLFLSTTSTSNGFTLTDHGSDTSGLTLNFNYVAEYSDE